MTKSRIYEIVESMDPLEAVNEIAEAAKRLFSQLGEDSLRDFLSRLIGDSDHDKTVGMVHL